MKNDVKKLSDELQNMKIQIGVKEEIINKKEKELKKYDLSSTAKAEKVLIEIDEKLKQLSSKSDILKSKARKILDRIELRLDD